jgi:membrane protein DedA with SNARE-associated domain
MSEWIQTIFAFLADLGYVGVALALMIEVIPSEIVLSYAGYLVSRGEISFIGAVIAGTIGGTLAQLFLYWMGYYGGRPFLDKYGKYLLIHQKHLDLAEEWFRKYGTGVIFTARFIPVVRHAISIPAGIAKMSWTRFTFYTTCAVIPWSIFFIYLGEKLGSNWQQIDEMARPYLKPIIVGAIVLTALYVLYRLRKNK